LEIELEELNDGLDEMEISALEAALKNREVHLLKAYRRESDEIAKRN
jgi:hypothetical protein